MSSPTGRIVPKYRPTFHELPRYGGKLADHTAQLMRAVREMEELQAREIECWRMFGVHVVPLWDEILVYVPGAPMAIIEINAKLAP